MITGAGNIFIGNAAGTGETGSGKLYIGAASEAAAFSYIYGEMNSNPNLFRITSIRATGGATLRDILLTLRNQYWSGAATTSWDFDILHDMTASGANPASHVDFSIDAVDILTLTNTDGTISLDMAGAITITSADMTFASSVDSALVADEVTLGGYDIAPGERSLAISQENSVVTEAIGASDKTLPVRINGTNYKIMLHT